MATYGTTSRQAGEREWVSTQIIDDGQLITVQSDEIEVVNADSLAFWVLANSSSVSAGVVVFEGSPVSGYDGAWVTLATITVTNGKKSYAANVDAYTDGMPCRYVRARITTKIGNGTIDAYVIQQR